MTRLLRELPNLQAAVRDLVAEAELLLGLADEIERHLARAEVAARRVHSRAPAWGPRADFADAARARRSRTSKG